MLDGAIGEALRKVNARVCRGVCSAAPRLVDMQGLAGCVYGAKRQVEQRGDQPLSVMGEGLPKHCLKPRQKGCGLSLAPSPAIGAMSPSQRSKRRVRRTGGDLLSGEDAPRNLEQSLAVGTRLTIRNIGKTREYATLMEQKESDNSCLRGPLSHDLALSTNSRRFIDSHGRCSQSPPPSPALSAD